ncbi:LLM class flavin-dependent oxidoreductase [Microbacterium sp.]|uniref:LLM class flavin-dependent oxidoreductase n=1 Tax=Microbacterium sp. TaxID=51671 RepID=UPI0039E444BF
MTDSPPLTPERPFRLGFLTHVNGYGRSAARVYGEVLDTIQAAEDLGFDGAFIAQHHFGGERVGVPSPFVLLAAAASRTRRIHLGTAVSALPIEEPLRFAEDAAVLDELSGGRLQLGLGTGGANRAAFGAFGVSPEQSQARYDDALALVHDALEGRPIRHTGLVLEPPARGLRDRLWQGTGSDEKARRVAAAGDGLFIGTFSHKPAEQQLPLIDAYRTAWRGNGPSRVGAARAVFPGVSRPAALADLGRGLTLFRERIADHVDFAGLDDERLAARINAHYGSVDDVIGSLRADAALLGHVDYFFPVVQHEASTVEEEIARLEIIATQIAPELGWRSAVEPALEEIR